METLSRFYKAGRDFVVFWFRFRVFFRSGHKVFGIQGLAVSESKVWVLGRMIPFHVVSSEVSVRTLSWL